MPYQWWSLLVRIIVTVLSICHVVDAGFFRVNCAAIQHGRIDPIISPGQVASHVHKISGGYNIALNSDYTDMSNSKCTSCEIVADKSGYWTPLLYYQYPNGSFQNVPSGGHLVYYLGRGDKLSAVKPFPVGFKMVSGNPSLRSYDNQTLTWNGNRKIADRVTFACLDSVRYPETPNMVNTRCSSGMRAQIQFQSCWDGANLYKTDQSHVAYLSSIDNGACPSTHPVLLPHLFFEVYYYVNQINQVSGGRFVFANGDTTGYGFHGDFLNGWDPKVQAAGVTQCIAGSNPSGNVGDCAPLAAVDTLNYAVNCPERPPLIKEQVMGILPSLPGCNPPTSGPGPANNQCSGQTTPSLNPFTPSKASDAPTMPVVGNTYYNWKYLGSVAEPKNNRALKGLSLNNNSATIDWCLAACAAKGFSLAGTEYGQECYCDNSLQNGATVNTTGSTALNSMVCPGNTSQFW